MPQNLNDLRIAIVNEWLEPLGGAEQVFKAIVDAFPTADLYALTVHPEADFGLDRSIETTFLQRLEYLRDRRSLSLPIMPLAWRALGKREYDLVLSLSHAFSRFFPATGVHLSYTHAPLRYAWTPEIDGRGSSELLRPARSLLRVADRYATGKVDALACNSTETARRIRDFYGREATVVHPPVDVSRFSVSHSVRREDFLLGVSRWVPYKRLDLVISAGEALGRPVVIAGRGPHGDVLREQARSSKTPVTFVESPTDSELLHLYRSAAALVFPAIEDFGIIPIEAQACGTPVVGVAQGGSLDTIVPGVTGQLAEEQTVEAITEAVRRALQMSSIAPAATSFVSRFSVDNFVQRYTDWVAQNYWDVASPTPSSRRI